MLEVRLTASFVLVRRQSSNLSSKSDFDVSFAHRSSSVAQFTHISWNEHIYASCATNSCVFGTD